MFIFQSVIIIVMSLLLWIPLVSLVLWAFTFITDVTFNFAFVAIVSGVLAILSVVFVYIKEPESFS